MLFHHLGIATDSLRRDVHGLRRIGLQIRGRGVMDERQGVSGQFLVGGGPRLELLEQLPGSETGSHRS